jgi:hypothetical protein
MLIVRLTVRLPEPVRVPAVPVTFTVVVADGWTVTAVKVAVVALAAT